MLVNPTIEAATQKDHLKRHKAGRNLNMTYKNKAFERKKASKNKIIKSKKPKKNKTLIMRKYANKINKRILPQAKKYSFYRKTPQKRRFGHDRKKSKTRKYRTKGQNIRNSFKKNHIIGPKNRGKIKDISIANDLVTSPMTTFIPTPLTPIINSSVLHTESGRDDQENKTDLQLSINFPPQNFGNKTIENDTVSIIPKSKTNITKSTFFPNHKTNSTVILTHKINSTILSNYTNKITHTLNDTWHPTTSPKLLLKDHHIHNTSSTRNHTLSKENTTLEESFTTHAFITVAKTTAIKITNTTETLVTLGETTTGTTTPAPTFRPDTNTTTTTPASTTTRNRTTTSPELTTTPTTTTIITPTSTTTITPTSTTTITSTSTTTITPTSTTTITPTSTNTPNTTTTFASTNTPNTTTALASTNTPNTTTTFASTNTPNTTTTFASTNTPNTTTTFASTNTPNANATTSLASTTTPNSTPTFASTNTPNPTTTFASTNTPNSTPTFASTNTPNTTTSLASTNTPNTTITLASTNTPNTTTAPASTNTPNTTTTESHEKASNHIVKKKIVQIVEDKPELRAMDMIEILPTESHERASHKIVKKKKIVHIKKEDKPGLSAMDKREILATVSKAQLRKKQNMVNMKNEIVKEINNAKEILQNQDKHISQHIAATTLPSNHSELQNEKKTLIHSIKTILQANSTYLQDASLTTPLLAVQNVLGITQSSPVQKYTKSNNIFNITEKSKGITPTSNLKEAEHKTEVWKKDTHTFDAFTETPYNIVSTISPMQSPANNIHARLHEDDEQVIHPPPDMSAKKNIQINIQREYTNKIMNHTSPPFMPAHSPKLLKN